MYLKSFRFLLIVLVFSTIAGYAIIPPSTGSKASPTILELQKEIRKSYNKGYYAEKMRERVSIREKIAAGLLPPESLTTDTVFALTLLGRYSDLSPRYSRESLQNKLFDGPSQTGTVTDYYTEVSYGQMQFTGSCKGWYNVPGTLASYVGNNSGLDVNGGPRFVIDVIRSSDSSINFADYIQYYDNQGRPRIGFIAVVHTGADAAAGANNIWSHRWTFTVATNGQPYVTNDIDPVSGQQVLIDGDYAIQPELEGSNNFNGPIIEIGVFAHEFGHIFGLPDLYDTDNSSEGLGNWCLMAGGSYGGDGSTPETPSHMSAWCKKELGWVSPQVVTQYMKDFTIQSSTSSPVVYKIWRTSQPGSLEYFLIENRQKTGFDLKLPNQGLAIYHVDESQGSNQNENRYLVDLEQADGLRNLNNGANRGDAGDVFPGTSNNRTFDLSTNPNSNAYTTGATNVSVRNIRQNGAAVIADLGIGSVPYLVFNSLRLEESIFENGRLEINETGNIVFSVRNLEPVPCDSIHISFSIDDNEILILNSTAIDSILSSQTKLITIPGAVKLNSGFVNKMIWVKFTLASKFNQVTDSFRVVAGLPEILVISRSDVPSHIDYYETALDSINILPELQTGSDFPYMHRRKVLIYTTGNRRDSLFSQAEIDSLTAYLQHGGKLFISGQNAAEFLQQNFPGFLYNNIGVRWVKNNTPLTRNVYGIVSDPIGSQIPMLRFNGPDGAGNERSTDVLADTGGFNIAFSYKNTSVEGAAGWHENGLLGSKVFFMGFGFESINNLESSQSRNQIMAAIMNWFDLPVSVSDEDIAAVFGFSLYQNYPNPFNPQTNIAYELPASVFVNLALYDVTGAKVADLYNGKQDAGRHQVTVDAAALKLSSGIYIVRMNSGAIQKSIKAVLLK